MPPAPHEESAPVESSSELTGLEAWPHLQFDYAIERNAGQDGARLVVAMSFVAPPAPPKVAGVESPASVADEAAPSASETLTDLERYRAIGEQWEADNEVTVEASFCLGSLTPAGSTMGAAILRDNVRTIIAALETRTTPENPMPVGLLPLVFALPDPGESPASYPAKPFRPLAVTLHFRCAAAAKPEVDAPVSAAADKEVPAPASPSTPTRVPPRADAAATPLRYRGFATEIEAAYAVFGWRVLCDEEGATADRQWFLLRWQTKDGLLFSLHEPAAPAAAGFACPLLCPIGLTRMDISAALLPADFPARFAGADTRAVTDFDLDAELARFLNDVETFLAPERRGAASLIEPALVARGVAAKEALAKLLAERVVPVTPNDSGREAKEAARAALCEACRVDLRNFFRVGTLATLQLKTESPLPLVAHGQFRPDGASAPEVLPAAAGLATKENFLAFPVCVRAEGGDIVDVTGSFHCDAITPTDAANGAVGRRLGFVTAADTSVPSPRLQARVPRRSLPRPPVLRSQSFVGDEGDSVEAAKTWRLECACACEPARGDTLSVGVEFGSTTPAVEARSGAAPVRPDLLDALVIFRTKLPAIAEELDRGLRPRARAGAVPRNAPVRDAIRAWVMLTESVVQHFAVPATEPVELPAGLEGRSDMAAFDEGVVAAGPFTITRHHAARATLQVVRNRSEELAPAFRYATRVVRSAEMLHAYVDRELPLDLAALPPLSDSMPDDPPPGSLLDGLTRLLGAAVVAPGPKASTPALTVSAKIEFSARLAPGGPEIRMPVAEVPPQPLSPARSPSEIRVWARPIASHAERWLAESGPWAGGGFERAGSRLVFTLTLHAVENSGETGRRILRLSGLYFPCAIA